MELTDVKNKKRIIHPGIYIQGHVKRNEIYYKRYTHIS